VNIVSVDNPVVTLKISAQQHRRVDLSGIVVLLFGGAGNLARAFAYAASACGARIAIADNPPREKEKRAQFDRHFQELAGNIAHLSGTAPLFMLSDITSVEDAEKTANATRIHFNTLDVAVNFAGMHHPTFDITRDDPASIHESFRRVVELNLNGAFSFTVAVARTMRAQRDGHIIHLCSNASRLSLYGSYGYNASKHGVEGIIKSAAAQLAPYGIRVNGIAPGTVVTDLNRNLITTDSGDYTPRARSILAHTPTKRFATAEGVAETLLAMCLPQRHLTGNVIFADDGYNVEGHSWPVGNDALYAGKDDLQRALRTLVDPAAE